MNRPCMLAAILLLLPVTALAQTTVEQISRSGLANSRLIAARKAASSVTAKQCQADLLSWQRRNEADEKANVKQPNWWVQKLSTEELVRLDSESAFCSSLLRHANRPTYAEMELLYGRMFAGELLNRAEAVLIERLLMQEYLLKGSQ
jgi:hypothetical protein